MAWLGAHRYRLGTCGVLLAAALSGNAALAGTVSNATKLDHYDVHGASFAELLLSVQTEAPLVNGAIALAFLETSLDMQAEQAKGRQCKMKDVSFQLNHRMVIPRLADERQVPGTVRRQFTAFQAALRKHEEQHRSIYLRCIKRMRKLMMKVPGMADCDSYGAALQQVMELSRAQCDAENAALDARDGERTARLPLIRHALQDVANGKVPRAITTRLRTTAMRTHKYRSNTLIINNNRNR